MPSAVFAVKITASVSAKATPGGFLRQSLLILAIRRLREKLSDVEKSGTRACIMIEAYEKIVGKIRRVVKTRPITGEDGRFKTRETGYQVVICLDERKWKLTKTESKKHGCVCSS